MKRPAQIQLSDSVPHARDRKGTSKSHLIRPACSGTSYQMRLATFFGSHHCSLPKSLHRATETQALTPSTHRVRLCERLYRAVRLAVSASSPIEPGSSPEEVVKRITKSR